jgi:hypothetical protein
MLGNVNSSTNNLHFTEHAIHRHCGADIRIVMKATAQVLEAVDVFSCLLIDKGRGVS